MTSFFSGFFKKEPEAPRRPPVFLKNTLSGNKELFISQKPGVVLMYSCGPTVYGPAHIGNLRSYIFSDTLARTLTHAGFRVRRVINITDVGHLVGDGDEGEDKMSVGAKRDNTTPKEIADRYTALFLEDLHDLNIPVEEISFPRATDYIREQIALAKTLEEKGFAYELDGDLYFDTGRFPTYGALGNLRDAQLTEGKRVEKVKGKRHGSDFVLWRKAKKNDLQQWPSPWGFGNPGWHIECSAMARALLGQEIDIHTGGEDHIHIHHNNEIAQSEAASGRTFVHYWMHNAFLTMGGEKASKSLGNIVYLSDIKEKGFPPLALRYFFLQAHYSTPLSFSFDALAAAASALERLFAMSRAVGKESKRESARSEIQERFTIAMRDDLSTPHALALLWEALKSEDYTPEEKWGLLESADAHLGLELTATRASKVLSVTDIPSEVSDLVKKREEARKNKDFVEADRLREAIAKCGYTVDDTASGAVLTKAPL